MTLSLILLCRHLADALPMRRLDEILVQMQPKTISSCFQAVFSLFLSTGMAAL